MKKDTSHPIHHVEDALNKSRILTVYSVGMDSFMDIAGHSKEAVEEMKRISFDVFTLSEDIRSLLKKAMNKMSSKKEV